MKMKRSKSYSGLEVIIGGLCLVTLVPFSWSKLVLLERGIKPISTKSMAFTFYAAVKNEESSGFGLLDRSQVSLEPLRLQMVLCCQRIERSKELGNSNQSSADYLDYVDPESASSNLANYQRDSNWDCLSMQVHSGLAFHLRPNENRTLTAYFLNKHLLNRRGVCTFQIHNAPAIPPFPIEFSTRILNSPGKAEKNVDPIMFDSRNLHLRGCDYLDKNPLDNCQPADCLSKYTGFRSFYNLERKVCEPTTVCQELIADPTNLRTMDFKEHFPSLVLDVETNQCVNYSTILGVKPRVKGRSADDSTGVEVAKEPDPSSIGDFAVAYGITLTKLSVAILLTCTFVILICVILNFFFGCCFCNLSVIKRNQGKAISDGPPKPPKTAMNTRKKSFFVRNKPHKYKPLPSHNDEDSSTEAANKVIEEIKDRREMKTKPTNQNQANTDQSGAPQTDGDRVNEENGGGGGREQEDEHEEWEEEEEEEQVERLYKENPSAQLIYPHESQPQLPPMENQGTMGAEGQSQSQGQRSPEGGQSPSKKLPNVVQFLQHLQRFPYLNKMKDPDNEKKGMKSYFDLTEALGRPIKSNKKIVRSLDTESSLSFYRQQPGEYSSSRSQIQPGQEHWPQSPAPRNNYNYPRETLTQKSQLVHVGSTPRFSEVIHKIQEDNTPVTHLKTSKSKSADRLRNSPAHVNPNPPNSVNSQYCQTSRTLLLTESPIRGQGQGQNQFKESPDQNSPNFRTHGQTMEVVSQRLNSNNFYKTSHKDSDPNVTLQSPLANGQQSTGCGSPASQRWENDHNQFKPRYQAPIQDQSHTQVDQVDRSEVKTPPWASVSSFDTVQNENHDSYPLNSSNRNYPAEMLDAIKFIQELERRGQTQREVLMQGQSQGQTQLQGQIQHQPNTLKRNETTDNRRVGHVEESPRGHQGQANKNTNSKSSPDQVMRRIKEEPPIPMSLIYGNEKTEFHDISSKTKCPDYKNFSPGTGTEGKSPNSPLGSRPRGNDPENSRSSRKKTKTFYDELLSPSALSPSSPAVQSPGKIPGNSVPEQTLGQKSVRSMTKSPPPRPRPPNLPSNPNNVPPAQFNETFNSRPRSGSRSRPRVSLYRGGPSSGHIESTTETNSKSNNQQVGTVSSTVGQGQGNVPGRPPSARFTTEPENERGGQQRTDDGNDNFGQRSSKSRIPTRTVQTVKSSSLSPGSPGQRSSQFSSGQEKVEQPNENRETSSVEVRAKFQTNAARKIYESALRLQHEVSTGGQIQGQIPEASAHMRQREESLDDFPQESQILAHGLKDTVFEDDNDNDNLTTTSDDNNYLSDADLNLSHNDDSAGNLFRLVQGRNSENLVHSPETLTNSELSCSMSTSNSSLSDAVLQEQFRQFQNAQEQQRQRQGQGQGQSPQQRQENQSGGNSYVNPNANSSTPLSLLHDFWSNEFERGQGPVSTSQGSSSATSSSPSDQAVEKAFWIENFICPGGGKKAGSRKGGEK